MTQPLVSRPPYGEGSRTPLAVAELPSGGPAGKGMPLDSGIPGQSTFKKPEEDIRQPSTDDESIYRVDDADDLTKDRSRIDVNQDSADSSTSYNGLGKPEPATKTKYPYRDEVPNAHNASFLAELWKLEGARTKVLTASTQIEVYELKTAANVQQILNGLDQKFQERSRKCSASLKRADLNNLRWIFSVNCGNGPKAVKIKALPRAQTRVFSKLDLELSCSCPAWQWLGPEFHAKQESFQIGKPVGTASAPNIRDPERDNRVCKHVAAALAMTRQWEIPGAKMRKVVKKAMRLRRIVKAAMDRRACNVCTAQNALAANRTLGWRIAWEGGPSVYVRATGAAEFGEAKYQLRKEGQEWPSKWLKTQDLAGALGRLGFDRGWNQVSPKLQAWLQE